jgi:dipeptidyl aminopeptidase/acylaminoacyl peptidase
LRAILLVLLLVIFPSALPGTPSLADNGWKRPPQAVLDVLHAPELPSTWISPDGAYLLLADPVSYPPLAERAAPMLRLAGLRVDPNTGGFHATTGASGPRLLRVEDRAEIPLRLPEGASLLGVRWNVDGRRFALIARVASRKDRSVPDGIALFLGDVGGSLREVRGLRLNPLLDSTVTWMPDGRRLLVKSVPRRGAPPPTPLVPSGPKVLEAAGEAPRSTYEARDLLTNEHDERLFEYYATSLLTLVDFQRARGVALGEPGIFADISPSPDGRWILVERLRPPWSHETTWQRFARVLELWDEHGERRHEVASLPLADQVPIHGVPLGPRGVDWRATSPASLFWVEALDGGNPANKAEYRDRLLRLDAPFEGEPHEVFRARHRITGWNWGEKGGSLLVHQYERERRWRHEWWLDVEAGTARAWFDLSANERYADPGSPLLRPLPNGRWVLRQEGDAVYFAGNGASPGGDRPFLDLRSLTDGSVERLFRSHADRYEAFLAFAGTDRILVRRESEEDVPNYHLVTFGGRIEAPEGEACRTTEWRPVTAFADPTPVVRRIQKRLVTYTRADGVPLSFMLHLPPDYVEGARLPTVLYAYPLEYSDAGTAGQVQGSEHRFTRLRGASHLFFVLQGYAVLENTAMPVLGDPETAYDSFVEQIVADAEAAVGEAVRLGVADPQRIGVTGHSHGALMTVTLLAHSDLLKAGIARSGAYNHTIRPFGFQRERRTLWEAREAYLHLSPVMHAPGIREPLLLIHGEIDENPGTVPLQTDLLFEALRGTGATVREVMLPFEGHGYRARESVEHVLAEQIEWFDRYVKESPDPKAP